MSTENNQVFEYAETQPEYAEAQAETQEDIYSSSDEEVVIPPENKDSKRARPDEEETDSDEEETDSDDDDAVPVAQVPRAVVVQRVVSNDAAPVQRTASDIIRQHGFTYDEIIALAERAKEVKEKEAEEAKKKAEEEKQRAAEELKEKIAELEEKRVVVSGERDSIAQVIADRASIVAQAKAELDRARAVFASVNRVQNSLKTDLVDCEEQLEEIAKELKKLTAPQLKEQKMREKREKDNHPTSTAKRMAKLLYDYADKKRDWSLVLKAQNLHQRAFELRDAYLDEFNAATEDRLNELVKMAEDITNECKEQFAAKGVAYTKLRRVNKKRPRLTLISSSSN